MRNNVEASPTHVPKKKRNDWLRNFLKRRQTIDAGLTKNKKKNDTSYTFWCCTFLKRRHAYFCSTPLKRQTIQHFPKKKKKNIGGTFQCSMLLFPKKQTNDQCWASDKIFPTLHFPKKKRNYSQLVLNVVHSPDFLVLRQPRSPWWGGALRVWLRPPGRGRAAGCR